MCLGVPMRIVAIDGDVAHCEVDGVQRDASLMMIEDVAIGDFVLIHAGFAIARLDPVQAEETLAAFRAVLNQGEGPT